MPTISLFSRESKGGKSGLVAECIRTGQVLETVPLEQYKALSPLFEQDVYDAIDLKTCVEKRISAGGTGKDSVLAQIAYIRSLL